MFRIFLIWNKAESSVSASIMAATSIEEAQQDLTKAGSEAEVVVDMIEMEGEAAVAVAALCEILNEHDRSVCRFIERLVQNAYGCGVSGGHGKYSSLIRS